MKVNINFYLLVSVFVFIFIFGFDWVFHGIVLSGVYRQTSYLWRPSEYMGLYMPWMLLGQFLFSFIFCLIFLKGYENKGPAEGMRYGFWIAALFGPSYLVRYTVTPLPAFLVAAWVIGLFIEMILAGLIAAVIYRPKP